MKERNAPDTAESRGHSGIRLLAEVPATHLMLRSRPGKGNQTFGRRKIPTPELGMQGFPEKIFPRK